VPCPVKCNFQIFRGLVEAGADVLPGPFVFASSRAHLSFQFCEGMLSRVDGCLNFVPDVGLQQPRLDRKGLEPQLQVRQPFLKTVLKRGAPLVVIPLDGQEMILDGSFRFRARLRGSRLQIRSLGLQLVDLVLDEVFEFVFVVIELAEDRRSPPQFRILL